MFNAKQLRFIQDLLSSQQEAREDVLSTYHKSLPQTQANKIDILELALEIDAIKEVLTVIRQHLDRLDHNGDSYLDIPNKDGETWECIKQGKTKDVLNIAKERYGADEFGYISLVTLGEAKDEDEDEDEVN